MIYPDNAAEKLGFADIKALIKAKCLSDAGKELVEKIQPQTRFEQLDKFLRQAHEFKELLTNDAPLPVDHLYPIKPLADKVRVEGAFLAEADFFNILLSLKTVFAIIRYFNERSGTYPSLEILFEHLPIERNIVLAIERVIDEKGKVRANASPALADILSGIAKAEQQAHKRIDQVFRMAQQNGWTADGNLTIRDGRLCIPVLAENKRKIKGWIHDESATGQTAYIEPEEVFHLNNQVRNLEFEKRREIVRILTVLTDQLRPHVPLLIDYHNLLTKVDFVRAKALFALDIEGHMPELSKEASVSLVNARHPLLLLNFKGSGQTVVPLNVNIDQAQRIIVVSGPNAGGKSVCMKTIGLLQLMVQAGLLIPADPTSKLGVFDRIFADIGDDQSIESDLSTYSAHLSKMKYFSDHANAKTLVLIDEFGTGTDPMFGGPIAEAVLEVLNRKSARGVVTTHYSNLKVFASNTEGVENASMLFDNVAMRPLYILQTGKPGSSYAFEIAQKIGLNTAILQAAKQKIGAQQKRVDTLLVDLERDKKEVYDTKVAIAQKERQLARLKADNEQLQAYLEENKKTILNKAKEEAREIIRNANKLVENTISGIKASQADKQKTKMLRQQLNVELDKHTDRPAALPSSKDAKQIAAQEVSIRVGDWVKIPGTGNEAEVIGVSKNNLVLAMGELRMVKKRSEVEPIAKKSGSRASRKTYHASISENAANFSPEVDVRGMRTEAALYEIEKHLDKAVMMGFPSLKIIHGKGDGILRKFIRDYLRKYGEVTRMEDEHADRGGEGITYAYLD
ncbi:endonuclease MutS2 [Parapedobacter indicus]|uniref:Endonuclease MutS2 n=1 Tax=Parapedobacter indicus TaxID=1477437 RepID=A0A1I3R8Q3_9SPHI|nr:endonuclease MutS2 [Parapedobacter indicus]PPL00386.1 DNA mismatch repair protein MutS2 [Parapedobacter indicus]SFJ42142.1 DNA mismatch repair protein MutS2 [Parapedobacter indicus]